MNIRRRLFWLWFILTGSWLFLIVALYGFVESIPHVSTTRVFIYSQSGMDPVSPIPAKPYPPQGSTEAQYCDQTLEENCYKDGRVFLGGAPSDPNSWKEVKSSLWEIFVTKMQELGLDKYTMIHYDYPTNMVVLVPKNADKNQTQPVLQDFIDREVAPREAEASAKRRGTFQEAVQLAVIPPILVLVVGSALFLAFTRFSRHRT